MMDIKRRTRNLYHKYGTTCPYQLAKRNHITVLFLDLPGGLKGYCQRVFRRKFIVINRNAPEEEQRFICAHELGHMLLHRGMNHYFITRETYFAVGKYEREANEFAVKLLTCAEQAEHGESLAWYLRRCGVPPEMDRFY